MIISIHAPPRGATLGIPTVPCIRLISIHAPPRGATSGRYYRVYSPSFQFTPLREGRLQLLVRFFDLPIISIHAPPRGATLGIPTVPCIRLISIHAPPRGATVARSLRKSSSAAFQFTPLREGRRCPAARSTSAPIFQFTPLREGRRSALIGTSFGWMISIHAPPRGATRSLYRALALSAYFNSRPSARGDKHLKNFFCVLSYFNSRPSARGDAQGFCAVRINFISIHAPPRGATSQD